jgi:hypothetical protein
MFPQFLPGNKAVLFTVIPTRTNTPMELANAFDTAQLEKCPECGDLGPRIPSNPLT